MAYSEKWAWWTVGVVVTMIAAYGAFLAFRGHGPASSAVFALLALIAIPAFRRSHVRKITLDERERQIASRSLRAGFSAFWVAFVGIILAMGLVIGWETALTVPVWIFAEILLWGVVLVSGVQALTTIILNHSGSHA